MNEKPIVVIDNGSSLCKAGFSEEDAPRALFPAAVGRLRQGHDNNMVSEKRKEFFVGDEIHAMRDVISLNYPIQRGIVTNWDDMEKIWSHMFHRGLGTKPEDQYVMITEAALNPRGNRERMAQVMFEKFEVPGLYVTVAGATAIYAPGRCTGIVLDCGDGVTQIVPVYEGCPISHAIRRLDFAGTDVTRYLQMCLHQNGYSFTTSSDFEILLELKRRHCYTSFNIHKEETIEIRYTLPDGQMIALGNECFLSPEVLFQPSLFGRDLPGIHELLNDSIMACDCDIRRQLLVNIILSGGATQNSGFYERLSMEMTQELKPSTARVMIHAPPERALLSWIGGSIISSLSTFKDRVIPKKDYDEIGPSIVHRGIF